MSSGRVGVVWKPVLGSVAMMVLLRLGQPRSACVVPVSCDVGTLYLEVPKDVELLVDERIDQAYAFPFVLRDIDANDHDKRHETTRSRDPEVTVAAKRVGSPASTV